MEKETLEEAAENQLRKQNWDTTITLPFNGGYIEGFQQGANWQAERMYSEKEVQSLLHKFMQSQHPDWHFYSTTNWFEKFKKK